MGKISEEEQNLHVKHTTLPLGSSTGAETLHAVN
jgi:hypothetical protein